MSYHKEIYVDSTKIKKGLLRPVTVGEHVCKPSHTFGPYIRDYYLIHYCISGKGRFIDKYGDHDVKAGEFFTIHPGEVTTYTADPIDPWHYVWISFDGGESDRFATIPSVTRYEADTFEHIREYVRRDTSTPEIYLSHIYELMHNLFSETTKATDVCRQVKDYIKYNYMDDITVEKIAQGIGLNRRYLSRIFKEKYGMPIKEYIVSVRIKKACGFLENGYTVAESAFMSGYTDSFTFSKMFRKTMGVPPSEWKTGVRGK